MKAQILLASLAASVLIAVGGLVAAEKAEKKFNATCPVSGKPAIESSYVEESGKKVYFCCTNCPKAYAKDPKKFTTKTRKQMLETEQLVQVACPVSGHPVDDDATVKYGEGKVGFCCEKCVAKFEKASDDEKLTILFAELEKGFTAQTMCPVSNKPINVEAVVEHDGKKVYFCCPNCPKAFEANPEKYTAKLPQFAKAKEN